MSKQKKVILITGVSSGIGRRTAQLLAERGHTVFGASRNPECCDEMPGVKTIALDINKRASVEIAMQKILDEAGHVDTVINNAAYLMDGAIEEAREDEIRELFEVNYLGTVRVNSALLPSMRRRGAGRIINTGSIAGFAAVPFMGHYSALKAAIAGYSEALYHEVIGFGLEVCVVEPGAVQTPLHDNGAHPDVRIEAYDLWRESVGQSMHERVKRNSLRPDQVARVVVRLVEARKIPLRKQIGTDSGSVALLKRLAPERIFQFEWRKQMGLHRVERPEGKARHAR